MADSHTDKVVHIYTDGGCRPNPGVGGWAAILVYEDRQRDLSGGELDTTNNRMELQAAIQALRALKRQSTVDLFTDSRYVKDGITQWINRWKARGWRTASKKPVKNVDLWRLLDAQTVEHGVTWHWVKGHAGDQENERADELARRGIPEPAEN